MTYMDTLKLRILLCIIFYNDKCGKFIKWIGGILLSFIIVDVGNLDSKLEDYFKLSFIVIKLGNLDAMLVGYFKLLFHNGQGG